MSKTITLKEITEKNLWPIMKLNVKESQKKFVAPNANSIAEAYFSKEALFRAIYADDEPVGFVMLHADEKEPEYFLWRLMVDKNHQGMGYGFQAMKLVTDHVKTLPGAVELLTSYVPGDGDPSPFYYKIGFEETGEVEDGEKVLKLRL